MLSIRPRTLAAFLAVAATLAFVAVDASAAPKYNSGSRGSRTNIAPPSTATAPNAARPIERTATQPSATSTARPSTPAAAPGGFFGRFGLLGGLAGGLLGAGLIGMLLGHGFLGGLGGIASFIGLVLQAGIIALVVMLVWRWWQRRSQPTPAFAGGPQLRDITPNDARPRANFSGFGGLPKPETPVADTPIEIMPADFDVFERLLGEIQTAYGAEDVGALRMRMTPEMLSYYSEELARNASRGVVNQLSNVKLLQGDLAEAWREGDEEYATVAMRFTMTDRTLERASGRVVEGGDQPQEFTELWTFRRTRGGNWLLSAIQQTQA